jgi:hypothetical protein
VPIHRSVILGDIQVRRGATGRRNIAEKAKVTLEDGVFTLKLDEGISLAMLVAFAQDMFSGVSAEDIGVWRGRCRTRGVDPMWRSSFVEVERTVFNGACFLARAYWPGSAFVRRGGQEGNCHS